MEISMMYQKEQHLTNSFNSIYSFLAHRKGIPITDVLQKFLDESRRKPIKIWADQGSEFYGLRLHENGIEMY